MAGRLIGAWNPALDSNGNPISGAKLYTYVAGTTTNKTTYTDSGLGTPNANPVLADSAGRFAELWSADGGTYDLKWTDAAGVQIELFQSIQALGASATGAVARDFGADGKFNLESRAGTTYLESGDADPDNTGGKLRLGGWAGTQLDTLILDVAQVSFTGVLAGVAQRGAIGGLVLSAAGSTGTFGIAAGQATDSTGATSLKLGAAITKTTAAWSAGNGNGALDTGAIANGAWYHVYLIANVTSGAVDVAVSTSASAPTLPTGYTLYRRVGSMKTDGSAHWLAFVQAGDEFLWLNPVNDLNSGAVPSLSRGLTALSVPSGVKVNALFRALFSDSAGVNGVAFTSPDESDQAQTSANADLASPAAAVLAAGRFSVRTNTSRQFGARAGSTGTNGLSVTTFGWVDRRGKDD